MLRQKYIEKYQSDEHELIDDLKLVGKERNSFMHSIWMFLALLDEKEREISGEKILRQYFQNAERLFNKVIKLSH